MQWLPAMTLGLAFLAQDAMPPPEEPLWTAHDADHLLMADDWARPRHGERVVAMPAISLAVRAWLETPDATLVIIHPGGEAGRLWGSEVHDWLVALGLPPASLALRAGSPRDDVVVMRLVR